MRKATTALFAVAALAMAAPAFGAVLLNEPFTYGDGDIAVVSAGLWANHSGTTNPNVLSQELVVDGINAGGDVNRAFTAQAATATTYACLKVRVDGTAVSAGGNYFAHLRTASNFNFRSRVFTTDFAGSDFTFGIASASSGTTPTVAWGSGLTFGVVYTVVHSYNATTGESKLWVNPVTEASTSISSTAAAAAGEPVDSYAFRQSSSTVTQSCDDLMVAQSFAEACGGATPTTTTSWGRVKQLYR